MRKTIRFFSILTAFSGGIAFIHLASLPGGAGGNLLNLSPFRLVSLAGILAVIYANGFVFFKFQSPEQTAKLTEGIKGLKAGLFIPFLFFTFCLTSWLAFLYREIWISHFSEAIYTRLAPLFLLGSLVCLQLSFIFLWPHLAMRKDHSIRAVLRTSLLISGGFALLAVVISITKIGFTFDQVGLNWGPAGTPLTFVQLNLVLSIGLLLSFIAFMVGSRFKGDSSRLPPVLDGLIFLSLWILAVVLWSNQPMHPSHFAPAVSAPNYEYYPYSDAVLFDRMSYHLISGMGFTEVQVRRPLYVGLVALFHKVGGTSYEGTVSIQILLLALIPCFIYLITARLSNRLAGFLAGGLEILRETNAIDLSGKIVVSHAKLIMSDLAATLGIVIFVYVCTLLFAKSKRDAWLLLIAGAMLGVTALIRAQSLILLPLILLLALLPSKLKKIQFENAALVLLGFVLVILPWGWRNWNLTGRFGLGDQGEKALMARNYSPNPTDYPQPEPGETAAAFSDRLSSNIKTFIFEHPGDVAFFISNHFMHGLALSAIYLAPLYSTDSPGDLVGRLPFWNVWDGSMNAGSLLSLIVNLAILSFGMALAWRAGKLPGSFPVLVFVVYQFGNAIARTSGWRFALPVDWIMLVYFCIALSHLPSRIGSFLTPDPVVAVDNDLPAGRVPVSPLVFLSLLLLGLSVPLAERIIPRQNLDGLTDAVKTALVQRNILTPDQLANFLDQKNAVLVSGIALYPRFYKPDGGIYLSDMPEDFRFLHFWLINDGDLQVILPDEKPPAFFPHASRVAVIGCDHGKYISAWAVWLQTESREELILQQTSSPPVCP